MIEVKMPDIEDLSLVNQMTDHFHLYAASLLNTRLPALPQILPAQDRYK